MTLTARQVAPNAPIWDLLNEFGVDVGLTTNFPGEGFVFTVRHGEAMTRDYSCSTMHEVIYKATEEHARIASLDEMPDDPPFEDEDGSEAYAAMLERRAESGWRHAEDELPF